MYVEVFLGASELETDNTGATPKMLVIPRSLVARLNIQLNLDLIMGIIPHQNELLMRYLRK